MKIICKDNFDRQSVNDWLVAENVSQFMGKKIVDWLNSQESGSSSFDFFMLVEDDYTLFTFEP